MASDPYIGEIMIVGFNFAPRAWAECNGQLLPIAQNTALFSLLGTTFGGDGRTTFALPELRGRDAVHVGTGPGLSNIRWGQKGGVEDVTLNATQIPSHTHTLRAYSGNANQRNPGGHVLAAEPANVTAPYSNQAADVSMKSDAILNAGGGQSHTNMAPYLGLYHCIALQGIYPSRS